MHKTAKEQLAHFFTLQNPLGDIAAIEDADEEKRLIFNSYFDFDNQPYKDLRREPSMIIGRKGSGKTDALLSYRYASQKITGRYDPVVFFEAGEAAGVISAVINQITDIVIDNYPPPTVESVSEFWSNLFWTCIISTLLKNKHPASTNEAEVLSRFWKALNDKNEIPSDPHRVIISTIVSLRKAYQNSDFRNAAIGFFTAHSQLTFSGITLVDAKVAAQSLMRKGNKRAIILFDSIEAMDISETTNKLVISGLLKAVGGFQALSKTAQFRCCIPAETYFALLDLSSNVLKDFRNNHILHWHSSELLRICAKRYSAFLEIHSPSTFKKFVEPYNGFGSRSDVISFWQSILPKSVPNTKVGVDESTIPYITRHTQLLPRHFLLIFNHIIASAVQENRTTEPSEISAEMVQRSVALTESLIVDQVLDSYRRTWPDAKNALISVLPELNANIVTYSELHQIYNRSGGGRGAFQNISSFEDFLKMLSELGAIGRLTTRTKEYATATFEYGEPHRLLYTVQDTLCIHPIFTEKFRVIVSDNVPKSYLPVYPVGTDPNSSDYRERW